MSWKFSEETFGTTFETLRAQFLILLCEISYGSTVHEITASHRSLSDTISCVTDRMRFLPVAMTVRSSNFNSTSYTEDRHEFRVTGTRCRLPDTMSGTGEISILSAELCSMCATWKSLLTRKRTRKKAIVRRKLKKFWMLRFFCEVHFLKTYWHQLKYLA